MQVRSVRLDMLQLSARQVSPLCYRPYARDRVLERDTAIQPIFQTLSLSVSISRCPSSSYPLISV